MFRAKTLQRHDERGPASGFRSEDCLVSPKIFRWVANKLTRRCVPAAPGQDHGPGEAAPAGYLLCQRAGKRHPVQSQREEGFPVRAAGHFQRADRQEERAPPAGVHLQKQHQGEHQSTHRSAVTLRLLPVSCVLSGQLFGSGGAPRGASRLPGADLQRHRRQRGPLPHASGVPANKAGLVRRRGPDFRDSEELPQRWRTFSSLTFKWTPF